MSGWMVAGILGVVATVIIGVGAVLLNSYASSDAAARVSANPALKADVVREFAPGAIVADKSDGGFSVYGLLAPPAIADRERAYGLLDAGPLAVTCNEPAPDGIVACTPVSDDAVLALVSTGARVYQRAVRGGLSDAVVEKNYPLISADELTCGRGTPPALQCRSVKQAPPTLRQGEREVVTYRPLHISFRAGVPTETYPAPTIPVRRAAE